MLAAILCTTLAAGANGEAPPLAAPERVVRIDGDRAIVRFDEVDGTRLDAFAAAIGVALGRSIDFPYDDAASTRLRYLGVRELPVDQLWWYLCTVARANGAYVDGARTQLRPEETGAARFGFSLYPERVRRPGCTWGYGPTPVLRASDLAPFRFDAGVRFVTSFSIEHADFREASVLLGQAIVGGRSERSIRIVTNSSAVILRADGPVLHAIFELMPFLDAERDVPLAAARVVVPTSSSLAEVKEAVDVAISTRAAPVRTVADPAAGVLIVFAPAPELGPWVEAVERAAGEGVRPADR